MRKLVVLAAFAVLASLPAAAASPARTDPGVLAIDRRVPGTQRLVIADPLTLLPRGARALDLAGHAWPYAFSSDRSRLVLGRRQPPSLRLVDARRLRLLRDVPLGGNRRVGLKSVAWLDGQIVALVERAQRALALLRVDPAEGRVVGSTAIGRWSVDVAATRARFVVLLAPIGRIGSARLLVVTADRVRTVGLPGIRAGSVKVRQGTPQTAIQPGLALSPEKPRAWVIAAGGSVEVDLQTLAVRYRGEPRHRLSPQKPPVVGSARDAHWLSPGRLVVAGWDANRDHRGEIVVEPSGMRLLETTAWTDRTLDPRALLFYVRPRRLLTIAPGQPDCAAPMLTAYTPAGVEVYRVCDDRATGALGFAWRYARLGRVDGRVAVIDVESAALVARVRDVHVSPLETTFAG